MTLYEIMMVSEAFLVLRLEARKYTIFVRFISILLNVITEANEIVDILFLFKFFCIVILRAIV